MYIFQNIYIMVLIKFRLNVVGSCKLENECITCNSIHFHNKHCLLNGRIQRRALPSHQLKRRSEKTVFSPEWESSPQPPHFQSDVVPPRFPARSTNATRDDFFEGLRIKWWNSMPGLSPWCQSEEIKILIIIHRSK